MVHSFFVNTGAGLFRLPADLPLSGDGRIIDGTETEADIFPTPVIAVFFRK
jgi:hypothetical protein